MIDYKTPSPDEGHEAIRAPLAQAIDDLAANTLSVGDAMMLINGLANLAGTLGAAIPAAEATHTQLWAAVKAMPVLSRGSKTTTVSGSLLGIGAVTTVEVQLSPTPNAGYVATWSVWGTMAQSVVVTNVENRASSVVFTLKTTAIVSVGATATVSVIAAG